MRDGTHLEKGQKLFSGLGPLSEVATARPVAILEGVATRGGPSRSKGDGSTCHDLAGLTLVAGSADRDWDWRGDLNAS
ncbi:hypothetical protein Taro_055835 [Colocasia esculenta]|uniref:Uncharacterized protein n=1 Tax=Colocasia esculenta TaxID=4460 RepID=A0A843XVH4_COLES|nr:hypothetical protein [Colocasia esculenta]